MCSKSLVLPPLITRHDNEWWLMAHCFVQILIFIHFLYYSCLKFTNQSQFYACVDSFSYIFLIRYLYIYILVCDLHIRRNDPLTWAEIIAAHLERSPCFGFCHILIRLWSDFCYFYGGCPKNFKDFRTLIFLFCTTLFLFVQEKKNSVRKYIFCFKLQFQIQKAC